MPTFDGIYIPIGHIYDSEIHKEILKHVVHGKLEVQEELTFVCLIIVKI